MNSDDLRVMFVAGLLAAVIMVVAASMVHAEESPKPPLRVTCWTVRKAVQIYKEADLIAMARSAGISEAEIDRAKRCLNR
jgi:hypothetical protein